MEIGELAEQTDQHVSLLNGPQLSLLRSVALELKTPLTHIAGTSSMLTQGSTQLTDEVIEQLRRIELSSDRLLNLVDGLILAGRAAEGQLDLPLQPTNVAAVVSDSQRELAPLAARYGRTFSLHVTNELTPASAHSRALNLICYSLFDTVMRTSQSEVIELLVHHQVDDIMVTIRDDGDSIRPASLRTLLTKLGTSAQPSAALPGVSGLSLFIADSLLTNMSGRLHTGRVRGKRIVSFSLPRSEQLCLVNFQ
jgi:K+-sensing histidine kinase KdpD